MKLVYVGYAMLGMVSAFALGVMADPPRPAVPVTVPVARTKVGEYVHQGKWWNVYLVAEVDPTRTIPPPASQPTTRPPYVPTTQDLLEVP